MLHIKCPAHNKFIINGGPLSSYRDSIKEGTVSVSSLMVVIESTVRTEITINNDNTSYRLSSIPETLHVAIPLIHNPLR